MKTARSGLLFYCVTAAYFDVHVASDNSFTDVRSKLVKGLFSALLLCSYF